MKFISLFLLLLLCGCCSQNFYEKGDIYNLRINTTKDINNYMNKVQNLEKKINLKKLSSYNKEGLHIFDYASYATNYYYFFVPTQPSVNSFYINNINGINTCGPLTFKNESQKKILAYEPETFPYLNIYRDGKFPLHGEKTAYRNVLGYKLLNSGEKKYFSYYLYKEQPVGKKKLFLVNFPSFPKIIDEYEGFINLVYSTQSAEATVDFCRK